MGPQSSGVRSVIGVGSALAAAGLLFWPLMHILWNTGRYRRDGSPSDGLPEYRHAWLYCSDTTLADGGKAVAVMCSLLAIAAVVGMFVASSAKVELGERAILAVLIGCRASSSWLHLL